MIRRTKHLYRTIGRGRRADSRLARAWIDAMISELESKVPDGLCAATFFVSTGGDVVLSFAEWTSPEAHRRPMHDADFQQYVSIDDSRGRGGAPIHAGITSEREI